MSAVVIRGGEVIDASGRHRADVATRDGVIVAIGDELDVSSADLVLDAEGCIVAPGFVDLHAHLREPGDEEAETIATGTRGAVLGGFTTVLAMPNTTPAIDCASMVRDIQRLSETALCNVLPVGAITKGREGRELAEMAEMARLGVTMFTDDGNGVADAGLMRRAMEYAGGLGVTLAQHCDDPSLSAGAPMHEGEWSSRLGMPGQPALAEELMVMRDIELARITGTRLHIQHVSTAGSVERIRRAKADGLAVTCEATTHHFTLDHSECASFDPVFKVHPPLRTTDDVTAVKAGLGDGTIDAIATDHAPHAPETKEMPFDQAPPGMLGLETALALALTELKLPLQQVVALMSWQPAAIAGIGDTHDGVIAEGKPADLVVFDPAAQWTIDASRMASPSQNSPYDGRQVTGRVRHTVCSGEPIVIDMEAQR